MTYGFTVTVNPKLANNDIYFPKKENKMFVAVVYKYHPDTDPDSHKEHGGWESFLADSKEAAIEKAILAASRWEVQPTTNPLSGKAKYYNGPYRILVGELTEEAKRTNYTLVKGN